MELKDNKHFCILPWIHLHVWPNGKTFPCCLTPYEHDVGNANTSGLKGVWNEMPMKQLRLNMLNDMSMKEMVMIVYGLMLIEIINIGQIMH